MARGFLSGVLWGGVVGVSVSAGASVLAPPPVAPQVSDVAPDGTQVPARIENATSTETASTADRTVVTGTVAPQAPMPELDSGVALDSAALTSPAQPDTSTPSTLADPQTAVDTAGVTAGTDVAVIPTPQALAPMEPQEPDVAQIDTTPAQPPAPEVAQTEAPAQPAADLAQDDAPSAADDAAVDTAAATQAEATPSADDTQANAQPETQNTTQDTAQAETQTDTQDTTADSTQTAALAPEPTVEPLAPPTSVTEDTTATQSDDTRPRIGQPVGSLTDRDTGVTIRRPSSANLGEVDDGAAEDVAVDTGAAATNDDPRPISRFSAAFTPEEGKPLMAIVLIDDGTSPVTGAAGIAALRGFPYPLSFAVDSSLNDATERMDIYRKEGFEVLAMIDLPEGAQPSDAETTFGVVLPQMAQVVGVLEGTAGGLQGSREVSDQVTSILLQTGHGLLAQDKGLNTMPKLARKEGVPADPIFRDFDSKGQTASVIRRFLDQAAFKAGQEGAVVMLGRLRPDTVSALLLWGLQDRAGKVSLAPISAVLLREE